MARTLVGMFDTFSEAQDAVHDLVRFGVRREDISLVARDEHGELGKAQQVGGSTAAEGAGAGALGGSVVGGALGLLIGAGLLVIPGIGPVLAAGPLAAAIGSTAAAVGATALGAGLGAATGGLLGSLMGAGLAEDEAHTYVEGVRRGGTLVSVNAADAEVDDVRQILIRNGAVDMDSRAAEWRAAGWDATGTNAYAAGDVSMGAARPTDAGIPRGDSYSVRGRDYGEGDRPGADTIGAQAGAEAEAAGKDWEDSSKLGTVGGGMAGAATGAAAGAAGGPIGSVVGGVAGALAGAGIGAAGDVAGERAEPAAGRDDDRRGPGAYDFRDDEGLGDAGRQVVDTSYTDVDRTGERVKGAEGFTSGHSQPFEGDQAQFAEFAAHDEENFRAGRSAAEGPTPTDADTMSESTRRAPHFAGADDMGGAISGMQGGSGSEQPGARSSTPGHRPDLDTARAGHAEDLPAHGDFARGMREERPDAVEPDYARGLHGEAGHEHHHDDALPHHGDFARGMREEQPRDVEPDYARGQRGQELYDADYRAHYESLTGSGGQPYDYYRPGYQFGHDLASDESFRYDSWDSAERHARQRWEREARGSWEEFKQAIRYAWEKARGRA